MQIPHQLMLLIHCATVPGTDLNSFFIFKGMEEASLCLGVSSAAPKQRPHLGGPVLENGQYAMSQKLHQITSQLSHAFPELHPRPNPEEKTPRLSTKAHVPGGQPMGSQMALLASQLGRDVDTSLQRAGGSATVPQRSEPGHHVPDEPTSGRRPQKPEVPVRMPSVRQALPASTASSLCTCALTPARSPSSAHCCDHRAAQKGTSRSTCGPTSWAILGRGGGRVRRGKEPPAARAGERAILRDKQMKSSLLQPRPT